MSNDNSNGEKIENNKKWFQFYVDRLKNHSVIEPKKENIRYKCPCCSYKTLSEKGRFDVCKICFWEDDGQDDIDADIIRGGPNRSLSLTQARLNFSEFGACGEDSYTMLGNHSQTNFMNNLDFSSWTCPLPLRDYPKIVLAHGGGGKLSNELVENLFLPAFSNDTLDKLSDSAQLDVAELISGRRQIGVFDGFVCRSAVVFSRRKYREFGG